MSLIAPQVLLLLVPLGLLLWWRGRVAGPALGLRTALLLALTLALARPEWRLHAAGSDVVVVVDRSRSMPPRAQAQAEELVRHLEPQRGPGDRLGVIAFGRAPRVEAPLTADGHFGGFSAAIDGEASDLSAALDAAGELVPADRAGRVLVISDGKETGLDARAAARRLRARGLPIDVRFLGRAAGGLDLAVTGLTAPPAVAAREPFLLTATVQASAPATATLVLVRDGAPLARLERSFPEGATVLTLRDRVETAGLAAYELRIEAAGDGVGENDVGRAVVRVEGPPRVLLLTDAPRGTLAAALAEADLALEVRAPGPLSMAQLEGVGAVVLEDVEASRLTEAGLHVLAQYVKVAGGGLVMTGGRHSFGEGGYRRSPLEPLLPVSLEVREEQRKAAIAMAIVMDCSCSMGAQVADGRTKMELAAEGVVGALQLLNPRDEASVHMVDTEAHEIFPMSAVADGLPLDQVARGFSGGGGIFVGVGLRTAKAQVLASRRETRHVLLFSDAADSEAPDDYQRTLAALTREGVTVSVIGMGSRADPDAKLLEEIAARGNGRVYFAEDVTSLPRIFSQETIAVARASFVETPAATRVGADLALLGRLPVAEGPTVGGYNLTSLRAEAGLGLRSADEHEAPVLALWPRGAGRVVALTAEVDGRYTGAFRAWPGQRALLTQAVRWALPPPATASDAVARAALRGDDLHVTLDLDPASPPPPGAPSLTLLSGDARVAPLVVPLRWEEEDRAGAHVVLPGSGTWHPVVRLGDRLFRAPPVTLPWAPEFDPAPPRAGQERLAAVARAGGGVERLAAVGLFEDAVPSTAAVPLAPGLVALAVVLLVAEVLARRMLAGPRPRRSARVPALAPPTPAFQSHGSAPPAGGAVSELPAPAVPDVQGALQTARERARRRTGR